MGFRKMNSTQVGLVLNLFTDLTSTQDHIVFYYMFYTVAISTDTDP